MKSKKKRSHIQNIQDQTVLLLKEAGLYTYHSFNVTRALLPIARLLATKDNVTVEQLSETIDGVFGALYQHPLTKQSRAITRFLRKKNILPNEKSTEKLIRFVVEQILLRSPVKVPEAIVNEFWTFFNELFSEPELKGLGELNLDILRIILRCYEPLMVEIINLLKETKRINKTIINDLLQRVSIVRGDLIIIRRQIKALRYVKPFFKADPKDFQSQAQILASMVREFGPFFIKMAQVAAANADFLPDEITKELLVFQEDVAPMTPDEVYSAFEECLGKKPHECYFEFNVDKPLKSGSIGSVYLAKKPVNKNDREVLKQVIVKISRKDIDREFILGRTVLGVAIISSHYWAPHSKLAPFLEAIQQQADEFVTGFQRELNFEQEAECQKRFAERSKDSLVWNVPELFFSSRRILEMEYIENATSIAHILDYIPQNKRKKNARRIASRFLYTILLHAFVYQEFHGDLHPGNVLFNDDGDMYFVDWGNCVDLEGKWKPLWDYVYGALLADIELLATALINISSNPEVNQRREAEIKSTLAQTLEKKNVTPLTKNFVFQLKREGVSGLHRRLQVVLHLMSNTQHLGLVVKSEYLHLSRSLAAIIGTYLQLYKDIHKIYLLVDSIRTVAQLPVSLALDHIVDRRSAGLLQMIHRFPLLAGFKNPAPLYFADSQQALLPNFAD
jgi:predicted unusual protein kinase regulating ubiquinone biosynthesis (AarF/ABC1/UbiB family)